MKPAILSPGGWAGVLAAVLVMAVLVPLLNLAVPANSAFHLSDFTVTCSARSCATPSARWRWT
jgi:urea transport system permease protein